MKCHENFPKVVKVGSAVVKVYRGKVKKQRRSYDLFTVAWFEHGTRQRRTFGGFADAKHAAQEIALRIAQGRADAVELSGADRDSYVKAIEKLRPFDIPLHGAIEEYVAARKHLEGESLLSAAKEHASRRRHAVDKRVREVVDELLA